MGWRCTITRLSLWEGKRGRRIVSLDLGADWLAVWQRADCGRSENFPNRTCSSETLTADQGKVCGKRFPEYQRAVWNWTMILRNAHYRLGGKRMWRTGTEGQGRRRQVHGRIRPCGRSILADLDKQAKADIRQFVYKREGAGESMKHDLSLFDRSRTFVEPAGISCERCGRG